MEAPWTEAATSVEVSPPESALPENGGVETPAADATGEIAAPDDGPVAFGDDLDTLSDPIGDGSITIDAPNGSLLARVQAILESDYGQSAGSYDYAVVKKLTVAGATASADISAIKNNLKSIEELDIAGITGVTAYPSQPFSTLTKLATARLPGDIKLAALMFSASAPLATVAFGSEPFTADVANFTGYTVDAYVSLAGVRLKNAVLPADKDIVNQMFNNCQYLETVEFLGDVSSIGARAFAYVNASYPDKTEPLAVTFRGDNAPTIATDSFQMKDGSVKPIAFVPDKTAGGYELASFTGHFSGVHNIGEDPNAPTDPTDGSDKAALNNAILQAEALDGALYTDDSWSALQTALAAARAVADKDGATQAEIDDAEKALAAAIENLAAKPGDSNPAPHGYLADIMLRRSSGTSGSAPPQLYDRATGTAYGQFEFDPAVTEYDIVFIHPSDTRAIFSGSTTTFRAELADPPVAGLYARFLYEGAPIGNLLTYGRFSNGSWSMTDESYSVFLSGLSIDAAEPRTVVLQIGRYRQGTGTGNSFTMVGSPTAIFDDVDEYTFNVYRRVALSDFSVHTDMEAAPLTMSPQYNASSVGTEEYTVLAPEGAGVVYVTAPYAGATADNGRLYFSGDGANWSAGVDRDGAPMAICSADNPYKLDLSGYAPGADGIYTVLFKIVYTGDGCGVDSCVYTLNVAPYDFTPVIAKQPAEPAGTFAKDAMPTLAVEVAPVQGEGAPQGEVSYQWYGYRHVSNATYPIDDSAAVPGATGAAFTPPAYIYAGDTLFKCEVTRTVGNVAFKTQTDLVNVTADLTYLSPPAFGPAMVSSEFDDNCEV
ncbi:MAG: hypothetical protein LBL83_09375, partial [Clostridiales bacterium]|nr:hypothetical protein [Clostridiales bacterium]